MIQNDARDAILLSLPRRGNCAGGGDPPGDAADNSSLFLFCSTQTLLWQKKVAVPPAILRCRFRNPLRLGFSYQTSVRCFSQDRSRLDPTVYFVCTKPRDRTPLFRPGQPKGGHR